MVTFWAKLEKEQGNRIREKIRINVNRFCRDLKTVLTVGLERTVLTS